MIPQGSLWTELHLLKGHPFNEGMLMLIARLDDRVELIGTAFLVNGAGDKAVAFTAAHNLSHIQNMQQPNPSHHLSTPIEFQPPKKPIDLSKVKAIYIPRSKLFACDINLAVWHPESDFAMLHVLAPSGSGKIFNTNFVIDNPTLEVGQPVVMMGYGDMRVTRPTPGRIIAKRRLIARMGTIEGVFPTGHSLLKVPSIQTTIQIYGGMSGGFVCRVIEENGIMPFALISHSLQTDPKHVLNQSISGQSVAVILQNEIVKEGDAGQTLKLKLQRFESSHDFSGQSTTRKHTTS